MAERLRPAAALLALALAGCAAPAAGGDGCDDAGFARVRAAQAGGSEVTVCGTVGAVGRAHETRSGRHVAFFVALPGGDRVVVDANLDELGALPLRRGERAVVHGEYYVDPGGRDGIHWVHHTAHGAHPPGYVTLDGVTYR